MIYLISEKIRGRYAVKERNMGEYAQIRKNGMRFDIRAFETPIGNFSTVSMSAMFGLMKMETVVFTPLTVDAPLFSFDRILAMGNDTLLLELYDTQLEPTDVSKLDAVKATAEDLPDHDLGKHWYDPMKLSPSLAKRGKKLDAAYRKLVADYADAYLALLETAPKCDPDAKRAKTAEYVDGLFANGGPSTDQFKKLIGEEKAKDLFSRFVFSSKA